VVSAGISPGQEFIGVAIGMSADDPAGDTRDLADRAHHAGECACAFASMPSLKIDSAAATSPASARSWSERKRRV